MDALVSQWQAQNSILLNVLISMVLGGFIGLEREYAGKPAGLRTLMFVTGASAMFVELSDILVHRFAIEAYAHVLRADPVRIIEAIITGISFLGAGTIFRSRNDENIEGLTTAASILICAAIGISVALEQWILAGSVTFFSIVILRAAAYLERRIGRRD